MLYYTICKNIKIDDENNVHNSHFAPLDHAYLERNPLAAIPDDDNIARIAIVMIQTWKKN